MGFQSVLIVLCLLFFLIILIDIYYSYFILIVVIAGTCVFVSVISNVGTWLSIELANIIQFANQVRMRLISQLISAMSRVPQKLL